MSDTADPPAASTESVDEVIELEAAPAEPPPPPRGRTSIKPMQPLSTAAGVPARNWPPKVLADIMTRQIIAIDETEPLGDIEESMRQFRFGHLPVVSDGRKLVGLITRTDFLHALLGVTPSGLPTLEKVTENTPAAVIMRQKVVTAKIDTPISTALRVMLREKLGCLPVVLDDASLVGIVTAGDFNNLALLAIEALEQSQKLHAFLPGRFLGAPRPTGWFVQRIRVDAARATDGASTTPATSVGGRRVGRHVGKVPLAGIVFKEGVRGGFCWD